MMQVTKFQRDLCTAIVAGWLSQPWTAVLTWEREVILAAIKHFCRYVRAICTTVSATVYLKHCSIFLLYGGRRANFCLRSSSSTAISLSCSSCNFSAPVPKLLRPDISRGLAEGCVLYVATTVQRGDNGLGGEQIVVLFLPVHTFQSTLIYTFSFEDERNM